MAPMALKLLSFAGEKGLFILEIQTPIAYIPMNVPTYMHILATLNKLFKKDCKEMGGRSCRDIKEEQEGWELGATFEQNILYICMNISTNKFKIYLNKYL